jgi:glycosidase
MTVAEHWVRRGIDGWRLDVPEEIQTAGFWEEFRERVRAVNPEAYLVGEIWRLAPDWIGERPRFDAVMNYRFTEAALRFVGGVRIDAEVATPVNLTLAPAYDAADYGRVVTDLLAAYPDAANRVNMNLLGSHDTPRVLSLVGGDVTSVRLAALLQFSFPGAPSIYYGDEIGMTGIHDPGSRGGFPWQSEDVWDAGLLETFRSLAALRREHPALRHGGYRTLVAQGGSYAFVREHEGATLLVAVNAADHPSRPWATLQDGAAVRLWGDGDAIVEGGILRLSLPPRAGGVWRVE